MKKNLLYFIVFWTAILLLPSYVSAGTSGGCGTNATWTYNGRDTLTISGSGSIDRYTSGDVTPWTAYNKQIRNVIVGYGITTIPSYTFEYLENLETVSLPNSLRTMACNAFNDCYSLKSITIPGSVTGFLGDFKFYRCYALEDIYYVGFEEEWYAINNYGNCVSAHSQSTMHFAVYHEGKDATCTEDGNKPYYAFDGTDNSAIYSEGKSLLSSIPVIRASHSLHSEPAVQPTCDYCGYTEKVSCYVCGTIIKESEEIPPLGHDYVNGVCTRYRVLESGTCGTNATWTFDSHGRLTISGYGSLTGYFSGTYTPWRQYNNDVREIIVHDGITEIPSYSFEYMICTKMVSLPNTLITLGCNAFNDCWRLEAITIPGSLENFISYGMFNRCYALKDIYYVGTEDEWHEINGYENCISNESTSSYHFATFHKEVLPTCTENGYKPYYSLDGPGNPTFYSESKLPIQGALIIPATGHNWNTPEYSWGDDNSSVTATRLCANNSDHVESETTTATGTVTKEPLCLEHGETTYTSEAFNNRAFLAQSITIANLDPLGHSWETDYTWDQELGTVTANRTCIRDSSHTESETRTISITVLPSETEIIEAESFENTAFEGLIIPKGCLRIEERAFADNDKLKYIKIPANTIIDNTAFDGCPDLWIDIK